MTQRLTKQFVLDLINEEQSRIVAGLRVKHKKTGLKYTVDDVTEDSVLLLTPELTHYEVTTDEFEKKYEPA